MIDLTKPKYTRSMLGVKIRAHRMILQLISVIVFIYLFGWAAFFLALWALVVLEVLPYKKWERWLNPWLHRELKDSDLRSEVDQWIKQTPGLKDQFEVLDDDTEFEKWLKKELKRDLGEN